MIRVRFAHVLAAMLLAMLPAALVRADGLRAPRMNVERMDSGHVMITVRSRAPVRAGGRYEIQRSLSPGRGFVTVAVITRDQRREQFIESLGTGVTAYYRARRLTPSSRSGWSRSRTISQPIPAPAPRQPAHGTPCNGSMVEAVRTLVNAARGTMHPLRFQQHLQAAAMARSDHMARTKVLSHDGWQDAAAEAGYPNSLRGENIAVGFRSASAVVAAWLNSPGHRANIMNPDADETGVGCIVDSKGSIWWTQLFGT